MKAGDGIFSCKRFRLSDHLLMETFISQEKDSEGDYGSAVIIEALMP